MNPLKSHAIENINKKYKGKSWSVCRHLISYAFFYDRISNHKFKKMNKLRFWRQLSAFFMPLNIVKCLQNYSRDKSFQSPSLHPIHILGPF